MIGYTYFQSFKTIVATEFDEAQSVLLLSPFCSCDVIKISGEKKGRGRKISSKELGENPRNHRSKSDSKVIIQFGLRPDLYERNITNQK